MFIKIFKKLAQVFSANVLAITLGFVSNKLIAIYLPYETIGLIGIIKSHTQTITTIILLGLNFSFFYLRKDNKEYEESIIVKRGFNFLLVNALAVSLIILLLLLLNIYKYMPLIFIALFISMSNAIIRLFMQRDASNSYYKKYYFYLSLQNIIFLTGVLISVFFKSQIILTLMCISVITIVFILLFKSNYIDLTLLNIKQYINFFKRNFYYAKYFFGLLVVENLYFSIIQIFLKSLEGNYSTIFNANFQVLSVLYIINTVLGTYLFPKIINNKNSREQYYIKYIIFISLFIFSISLMLFYDFFIAILYRKGFLSLSILFFFLLNGKVLEISAMPIAIKFQAELKFKFIYRVVLSSKVPIAIYMILVKLGVIIFNLDVFGLFIFLVYLINYIIYSYNNSKHKIMEIVFLFFYLFSIFVIFKIRF